jgi:hypothetical protein
MGIESWRPLGTGFSVASCAPGAREGVTARCQERQASCAKIPGERIARRVTRRPAQHGRSLIVSRGKRRYGNCCDQAGNHGPATHELSSRVSRTGDNAWGVG